MNPSSLIADIVSSFRTIPEGEVFKAVFSLDDFDGIYGESSFLGYLKTAFHLDLDDRRRLVGLFMEYYLKHYGRDLEETVRLEIFLNTLGRPNYQPSHLNQKEYELLVGLNLRQRQAVFDFFEFVGSNNLTNFGDLDDFLSFWKELTLSA